MSDQESTQSASAHPMPIYTCGDCGATEGELHNYFPLCDQEMCPICLGQLLSCKHAQDPDAVLKAGRQPFIHFPLLCARCGTVDPDFFTAPDSQWRLVVPKSYWHVILCLPCFEHIAKLQVASGILEPKPRKRSRRHADTDTMPLPLE